MVDEPAPTSLQSLLLWIVAAIVAVDCVWAAFSGFQIDGLAYLGLAAISAALFAGAWFYSNVRPDQRLCAMLFGTGFLCAFSAAFSALNYMLLTVAGPRIDDLLAAFDQSLGLHWPALVQSAADHPMVNTILAVAYVSLLPQIAALVVALGLFGRWRTIYSLCLAVAISAALTVAFWTAFPSFGPFTVYQLDPALASRTILVVDAGYVQSLVPLRPTGRAGSRRTRSRASSPFHPSMPF